MPTVLIIEDDPDMRELERTVLECWGFDVRVAPNGHEGLRALAEHQPCVILLDLMMPIMDGLTFLAEWRRSRHSAERCRYDIGNQGRCRVIAMAWCRPVRATVWRSTRCCTWANVAPTPKVQIIDIKTNKVEYEHELPDGGTGDGTRWARPCGHSKRPT